jgi:hypothetical protein
MCVSPFPALYILRCAVRAAAFKISNVSVLALPHRHMSYWRACEFVLELELEPELMYSGGIWCALNFED